MVFRSIVSFIFSLSTILISQINLGRIKTQDILVVIYAPLAGEAVQGQVPVEVGIVAPGYTKAELQFSYANQENSSWFVIAELDEIPFDGIIARWDTAAITDGIYDLRLVAFKPDGESTTFSVSKIRVRNYSPIETDTPTPVLPTSTLNSGQSTPEPISTDQPISPTITPFPTNPAIFTQAKMMESMSKGGFLVVLAFLVFGVYIGLSKYFRTREE